MIAALVVLTVIVVILVFKVFCGSCDNCDLSDYSARLNAYIASVRETDIRLGKYMESSRGQHEEQRMGLLLLAEALGYEFRSCCESPGCTYKRLMKIPAEKKKAEL